MTQYITPTFPPDPDQGPPGREIELSSDGFHVRWRYVGDVAWTNLVDVSGLGGATGATGETGPAGSTGPAGADGAAGATGAAGADGATGEKGDQGIDGARGERGARWYFDDRPTAKLGRDGDYCLSLSTGALYARSAGKWQQTTSLVLAKPKPKKTSHLIYRRL